jgi:phage terminase small subunit
MRLIPDEKDLARPELRALTEKQRAFVVAYVEQGMKDGVTAARLAGYAGEDGKGKPGGYSVLKVKAAEKLRKPAVVAAIRALVGTRLAAASPAAVRAMEAIVSDARHKDRAMVAKFLLEVEGFTPTRRVEVEQSTYVHLTIDELRARRDELLARVLGREPVTIDVEPSE